MMKILFAILLFPLSGFGQSFFWSHAPGEGVGGTPDTITTGVIENFGGGMDSYFDGTYLLAQTFTLSVDAKIKKVVLYPWEFSSSPDFDVKVELWDTSAGVPNSKITESTNVIPADTPGSTFTFNDNLTAGTYAFVVTYINVVTHNNSNLISFKADTSGGYTGGTYFYKYETEAWTEQSNTRDMISQIMIEI